MKVLLAQNMPHLPAYGGANRSGRIMVEQLAAQGHECHVVARAPEPEHAIGRQLARLGTARPTGVDGGLRYELAGVRVHAVTRGSHLVHTVRTVAAATRPDRILVPSD